MLRNQRIGNRFSLRVIVARLGLAFVFVMLAALGVADSAANVVVRRNPELAHRLAPWDGRAAARLAEQNMISRPAEASARLARQALRQDPTAVGALNVLGMLAQFRGETEQARRFFSYSLKLSRRELPPRIWAIEEAVSRGDIRGALASYDIALTTSNAAPDTLFPVLASAIDEPKVRTELLKILTRQPPWSKKFIDYVAASGPKPLATTSLFREGRSSHLPVDEVDRTKVVNALIAQGYTEQAWSYYATFRGGVQRHRSRDPGFALQLVTPSVFDWTVVEPAGISASIQPAARGGLFDFFAAPSASGVMLKQMQLLPPGSYQLEGRSTNISEKGNSRPYWTLTCNDGRELARVALPSAGSRFSASLSVPPGCVTQTLELVARSSSKMAGIGGQISYAVLRPIGASRQ